MTVSNKQVQTAWNILKKRLKLELGDDTFSFLNDAHFVGLSGSTVQIGVPNAFIRDWLEQRLKEDVFYGLSGIIGSTSLHIEFVISQNIVSGDLEDTPSLLALMGPDAESQEIDYTFIHYSLNSFVTRDERVVNIPTYYLRWAPYVGAKTIFLVVALRQLYFLRSSGSQIRRGARVSVRYSDIARWSGMSRRSVIRAMKPGEQLDIFLQKQLTGYQPSEDGGQGCKLPNTYTFRDLPLTPGDADDLASYLLINGVAENPDAALKSALNTDLNKLISFPLRYPDKGQAVRGTTIRSLVDSLSKNPLSDTAISLCSALAAKVLQPNRFISATWYFMQSWLPSLGPDLAMFILMLRRRCYFNDLSGEIRDTVWVPGYADISRWLGLKKSAKIREWFPAVINSGQKVAAQSERTQEYNGRAAEIRDQAALFCKVLDYKVQPDKHFSLRFSVNRYDPLLPSDKAVADVTTSIYAHLIKSGSAAALREFVEQLPELLDSDFVTHLLQESSASPVLSLIKKALSGSPDLDSDFVTDIKNQPLDACTAIGVIECLRYLVSQGSVGPDSARQFSSGCLSSSGEWDLSRLLRREPAADRDAILQNEISAGPLVSWILYGSHLSSIRYPIRFAVKKLIESPGRGAGGSFDSLASLSPETLIKYVCYAVDGRAPICFNSAWQTAMNAGGQERFRVLADCLGIKDPG